MARLVSRAGISHIKTSKARRAITASLVRRVSAVRQVRRAILRVRGVRRGGTAGNTIKKRHRRATIQHLNQSWTSKPSTARKIDHTTHTGHARIVIIVTTVRTAIRSKAHHSKLRNTSTNRQKRTHSNHSDMRSCVNAVMTSKRSKQRKPRFSSGFIQPSYEEQC